MLSPVLLSIHIGSGSLALLTAAIAVFAPKGQKWHILSGRVYAIAMALVS